MQTAFAMIRMLWTRVRIKKKKEKRCKRPVPHLARLGLDHHDPHPLLGLALQTLEERLLLQVLLSLRLSK
jgi:hypothetical protein